MSIFVNRLVPPGKAVEEATELARDAARWPQAALRNDRLSLYEQWSMSIEDALLDEYEHGMSALETGEMFRGLERYASGGWRDGKFV